MMQLKRHIGKLRNTDLRCVVVFMQIPDRPDHALIAVTDNLPPRYEQAITEIAYSVEGQSEPVLGNVLHRRLMPESNQSVLQVFHEAGLLRAEPINNIMMLPQPNMPMPLRDILVQMNAIPEGEVSTSSKPEVDVSGHSLDERTQIARNLIVEADLLSADAEKKRQKAREIAPELFEEPETKPVKKVKAEEVINVENDEATKEAVIKKTKRSTATTA